MFPQESYGSPYYKDAGYVPSIISSFICIFIMYPLVQEDTGPRRSSTKTGARGIRGGEGEIIDIFAPN